MERFFHKLNIEELGVYELKIVAKAMKINKYYLMKKKELINAIEAVRLGQTPQKPQKTEPTRICEHKRQ